MLQDISKTLISRILNNILIFKFLYILRRKFLNFNSSTIILEKFRNKLKKKTGYLRIKLNDEQIREAIKYCKKKYSPKKIKEINKNKKKDFYLYTTKIDPYKNKPLMALATNKKIISIISDYMGTIPILFYVGVWYTRPINDSNSQGSQLFHFDREDFLQIKLFIPIEPIKNNSGPMNVISANDTSYFVKKKFMQLNIVNKKDRFPDEQINSTFKQQVVKKLTAKIGELIFVDTTNCLHFGSRNCDKGKYHITLQYLTPYSRKLGSFLRFNKNINSPLNYLDWIKNKQNQ